MDGFGLMLKRKWPATKPGLLIGLLLLPMALPVTALSKSLRIVPKWGRFEQRFRSRVSYTNPVQQATLTVVFTSPLGDTNLVYGFWDGGRTWRVRFSPDQPGRWTYRTTCSDWANRGLEGQTGEFLCTAPIGTSRFQRHGPVEVARDHRHFQQADGTPFFWLADSTWDGARRSTPKEWERYAGVRAAQKFSAVQWSVIPGPDWKGQSAFTGRERVAVDLAFFRRLDAKINTLNAAGLLSVVVPFWGTAGVDTPALPEDQMVVLLRYMKARWGADDVAWLLDLNGGARWKEIGRAVFGGGSHAPVILYSGGKPGALDGFRQEHWVDAFGYGIGQHVDDASLRQLFLRPAGKEWGQTRSRPVIDVVPPYENRLAAQGDKRVQANLVRRAIWWSALLAPPAGVSYGAEGVVNWDTTVDQQATGPNRLPFWQKSLFLPGARQMAHLAAFFNATDFWLLTPSPDVLIVQPGNNPPRHHVAAARSETGGLTVVYVPADRTIELRLNALPPSPEIAWYNPRTGNTHPAVAVVAGADCRFPTPDPGDWVLTIRAGSSR